jgi:type IV pilus assembly protein PilA
MATVADGAVASVGIGNTTGVITVTYANVGALTGDPTVIFVPTAATGAVTWTCSTGTMADTYLPEDCK